MTAQPREANARPRGAWLPLAAGLALWAALIAALVYLVSLRAAWLRASDEINLREWIDEARVFRKSLPQLTSELLKLADDGWPADSAPAVIKRRELAEQLQRLMDPTRLYQSQLPLFPELYLLEVEFPGTEFPPVTVRSPVPQPRTQPGDRFNGVSELTYALLGDAEPRAVVRCRYRLHAYNLKQREAEESYRQLLLATAIGVTAAAAALVWAYAAWQRERRRELEQLRAEQEAEHARNQALSETLARQEAERDAAELRSQLYAGIGIMAGSYAHNIKNLLVRPNDLLARCLEADGLPAGPREFLSEVQHTLGTVTERLQQILRTVRRDPAKAERQRLDLNDLARELTRTWAGLAAERWKAEFVTELSAEPLIVEADSSHLTQALENLIFNARDATFEMRNQVRERARAAANSTRRQALLDAAAWKGRIVVRTRRDGDAAVIEVADNGVGMTADVRTRCGEAHFTTKRDNALFEGYTAGMGLGLSFVAAVIRNHGGRWEVTTEVDRGAAVAIRLPLTGEGVPGRTAREDL